MPPKFLLEKLAHPRTGEKICASPDSRSYTSGATQFPIIENIPWLFANPKATLWEWRVRIAGLIQALDETADQLSRLSTASDLASGVRERLQMSARDKTTFRNQLITHLSQVAEASNAAGQDAMRPGVLPFTQRLLS